MLQNRRTPHRVFPTTGRGAPPGKGVPMRSDDGPGAGSGDGRTPLTGAGAVDGTGGAPSADRAERVLRTVLVALLAAANALTVWLLLTALLVRPPGGRWEQEHVTAAGVPAMTAHIGSWLTEWGTYHLVRWGWLRPWWYAVPVVVALGSLLWMLVLMDR
ncbi:hypothetical protein ACWD6I_11310 [Streptomyces sp. NPDC002454]